MFILIHTEKPKYQYSMKLYHSYHHSILLTLTHCGLVTSYGPAELDWHMKWLISCLMASRFLSKCKPVFTSWTLGKKHSVKFKLKGKFFLVKYIAFENVICSIYGSHFCSSLPEWCLTVCLMICLRDWSRSGGSYGNNTSDLLSGAGTSRERSPGAGQQITWVLLL